MKFVRRPDLDVQSRIEIGILALINQGIYGYITHLSRVYKVSRTFVYQLLWAASFALLQEFRAPALYKESLVVNEHLVDRIILVLRLEGNCSLGSISNILSVLGHRPCSVGYISERLKEYAQRLSNTLQSDSIQFVLFLSDELFANSRPILITIEPRSMAILRIELAQDRAGDTWRTHWIAIEEGQFYMLGLVSDRAKGLVEGFKEAFSGLPHYPDMFHDLRDLAKAILVDLEKAAYKAIAYEYERYRVLGSARSDRVINERIEAYEKAVEATDRAIDLYDDYSYLFNCLQQTLDLFDEEGHLRDPQVVYYQVQTALDLMAEIGHPSLKNIVQTFKERLDSFLLYFQKAQQVYQDLSQLIQDPQALQTLCLAWQYNHKLYQAKTTKQKHYCQHEKDFFLEYAEEILGQKFQPLKQQTFDLLDTVVRSSSLVETVNSLIRPYLNTSKSHITQDTLNLIMFYHNHRKFNNGKRKNQAPIEILTGKPLEKHWLDLLLAA